jgi:cytochrome b subunit of formate dehydrogenase
MTDAAPAPMPPMAPPASDGKTLGVIAFVVVFFFSVLGIILGFVARGQSKRAGVKNGLATAAIVLGFVFLIVGIVVLIAVVGSLGAACNGLEPGTYTLDNGATLTCG